MAGSITERLNQKIQIAAIRILPFLPRNEGQILVYASAALALAAIPGASLPATLSNIASGIGIEALGALLGRMADGDAVTIEEIQQTVERALIDSKLPELLSTNQELAREIESLEAWQQQFVILFEHNAQLAAQLLAEAETLTGDVSAIREAVENHVATREQANEMNAKLDLILLELGAQGSLTIPDVADAPPVDTNPFGITGCIRDLSQYVVREPFTTEVLHELRKGVSVSIVGASQTGKSSFLWYLTQGGPQRLGRAADDFVYINMQLLQNDADFFACLCDELGLPTMNGYKLHRELHQRRIVLCLDEFEKMGYEGFTRHVRSELRGLADGQDAPLTLVIASRAPLAKLFADTSTETSPLAGICTQMAMPPFSVEESWRMVGQYLGAKRHLLSPQRIGAIWRDTQGHPQRLQQAFKHVLGARK